VFIFHIGCAFSSGADVQVVLPDGATTCNVFWKIEGLTDRAAHTAVKATVVANDAVKV
ncbi:MAG: DUF3494 domain-containing protein, partial [Chryseobacterium sp.]